MKSEVRGLTGVRGIAALYVVFYHFYHPADPTVISAFVGHGFIAVDLFFVLSGFVMALNYGDAFDGRYNGQAHFKFMERRFARVYPVYIVLTLFFTALALAGLTEGIKGNHAFEILCNVLLIQAWGLTDSITTAAWSVSVEWAAYFIFPFLVAALLYGKKSYALIGATACVALLAWVTYSDAPLVVGSQLNRSGRLDLHSFDSIGPMIRCMTQFSLGMLAYRFRNTPLLKNSVGTPFGGLVIAGVILLLLIFTQADLLLALIFPGLIVALYWQSGLLSKFFSHRIVYTLGVLSYSLYLVHPKFQRVEHIVRHHLIEHNVSWAEFFSSTVTLIPALALSALLYVTVERPCRSLIRRWFASRSQSPVMS
jgi:peptidoglycan/LPS O-acetylase OafA/YrhL